MTQEAYRNAVKATEGFSWHCPACHDESPSPILREVSTINTTVFYHILVLAFIINYYNGVICTSHKYFL